MIKKNIKFTIKFYITAIHIILFSQKAYSKSFGQINYNDTITILLLISIALIIVFSYVAIYYFFSHKKFSKNKDLKIFNRECRYAGLTEYEIEILKNMLINQKIKTISSVFSSKLIFEKCFHAEVNRLLKNKVSPKQRANEIKDMELIRIKLEYDSTSEDKNIISSRNINQGQKGCLLTENKDTQEYSETISNNAEIIDNNPFYITIKLDNKKAVSLIEPDMKLYFSFTRDGMYNIPMHIFDIPEKGLFRARHTLKIEKNQLRKSVRIDIKNSPVHVKLSQRISHSKDKILPSGEAFKGYICDISGGGFCFKASKSLCESDIIRVSFKLDRYSFDFIEASVVRIVKINEKGNKFRHHAQFIRLSNINREHIIKFIFNQQRKERKLKKI